MEVYYYQEPGSEKDILIKDGEKVYYFMRKPFLDGFFAEKVKVYGLAEIEDSIEEYKKYGEVEKANEEEAEQILKAFERMNDFTAYGLQNILVLQED